MKPCFCDVVSEEDGNNADLLLGNDFAIFYFFSSFSSLIQIGGVPGGRGEVLSGVG